MKEDFDLGGTALRETTETTEDTAGIITDDGVITPTKSPIKPRMSDRLLWRIVAGVAFVMALVFGYPAMASMGMSAFPKHELRSMTDIRDGARCYNEAFMVTAFAANQDSFEHYQATHPDEKSYEVDCRPVLETVPQH